MTKSKNLSWLQLSRKNVKLSNKNTKKRRYFKKENPIILKFKKMLEANPLEKQYMNTMISTIPKKYRLKNYPKTLDELFKNLNYVLTEAPEFNKTALVGTPFSEVLIWTMGSPEGFAAYRREKINEMFGELLSEYK